MRAPRQPQAAAARRLVPPLGVFVLIGSVVVLGVVAGVRLPPAPSAGSAARPTGATRSPGMVLAAPPRTAAEEELVREEMALLDPTPLFLPTRWTSGGAGASRAGDQEPGTAFREFGPSFVFTENDPALSMAAWAEPPPAPLVALAMIDDPSRRTSIALGRRDLVVPRLPARAGRLEVIAAGDGRTRLRLELALPVELEGEIWAPVELIALVDMSGMVGRPMALGTSGNERLDAALPVLLAQDRRIESNLSAGSYRLVVGP